MRLWKRGKAEKRNLLADRPANFLPFLVVTVLPDYRFNYWQECSSPLEHIQWSSIGEVIEPLVMPLCVWWLAIAKFYRRRRVERCFLWLSIRVLLMRATEKRQFDDGISERERERLSSKFRSIMLNVLSRKSFSNAQSKEASNKVQVISFPKEFICVASPIHSR